jgi:hypothetical protein
MLPGTGQEMARMADSRTVIAFAGPITAGGLS